MIEGLLTLAAVVIGTLAMNVAFDWVTGYPGWVNRWRHSSRYARPEEGP